MCEGKADYEPEVEQEADNVARPKSKSSPKPRPPQGTAGGADSQAI